MSKRKICNCQSLGLFELSVSGEEQDVEMAEGAIVEMGRKKTREEC